MSRAHVPPDVMLLGVRDSDLDPRRHPPCYTVNKVGGRPAWLPGAGAPGAPGAVPRCRRCGALQLLLVQVYCPLDPPIHRNLHVFCCHKQSCTSSAEGWTILRSQGSGTPSPPAQNQNQNQNQNQAAPTATDWCDSADDWGEEEEAGGGGGAAPQDSEAEFSSRLQELRLGATEDQELQDQELQDQELQEEEEEALVLRPFFIAVVEESDVCGEDEQLQHALQLLKEYESREGVASVTGGGALSEGGGASTEEKYEKSRARHGDAVFGSFMKRISGCPQQILRYGRGGAPLFISAPPAHHASLAPPCGSCGAARTLELQLMPALVSLLRWTPSGAPAQLEFGTVLVYTCSRSCWSTAALSSLEEFCYVQADPDQQLFS